MHCNNGCEVKECCSVCDMRSDCPVGGPCGVYQYDKGCANEKIRNDAQFKHFNDFCDPT